MVRGKTARCLGLRHMKHFKLAIGLGLRRTVSETNSFDRRSDAVIRMRYLLEPSLLAEEPAILPKYAC